MKKCSMQKKIESFGKKIESKTWGCDLSYEVMFVRKDGTDIGSELEGTRYEHSRDLFDALYSVLGLTPNALKVVDAKKESDVEGYIDLQCKIGYSWCVIRIGLILNPPDIIDVAMNDLGFRWNG